MGRTILTALLAWLALATATLAQEVRVALVIGNSGYQNVGPLANPVNDATDLAAALSRIGFDVTLATDLNIEGMRTALRAFRGKATGADMAIVYFAGHGVEIEKQNYLIPVDAKLETDGDVLYDTIPLDLMSEAVSGATKLRMVLLDACRNNPFLGTIKSTGRSIGRGLSPFEPSGGTLVAFAAKGGTVALDGNGRNSPFMKGLLEHIEEPGLDVSLMFRKVRDSVLAETNQQQEPFTYGSLPGREIYLVPPVEVAVTPIEPAAPVAPTAPVVDEAEEFAWRLVKDSTDKAELEEFILTFPRGAHVREAFDRIAALTTPKVAAITPTPALPQPVVPAEPVTPAAPVVSPSRELVIAIQNELRRAGCNPGPADGDWGRKSRDALSRFAVGTERNVSAMAPDQRLLDILRSEPGTVCPATQTENRTANVGGEPTEEPRSRGCYDVSVTVASTYPTGEDWDPWPGNRANPDPIVVERTTGARAACVDTFICALHVEGAGQTLSFLLEDDDPDASDPIGSGQCTAGRSCTVGSARISMSAC